MRDIYRIRGFLFNVWLLIKEIINLIFCIFFTFATFFVVHLIQFTCLTYILETGEIVLCEPYSSIVLYSITAFAVGCAVIVSANYDKLFNLKNSKNE